MKRKYALVLFSFFTFVYFALVLSDCIGFSRPLGFNKSNSLPYWVFYRKYGKTRADKKDFIICKRGSKNYVKKVVGVEGDEILFEGEKIFVAGKEVGKVLSHNPSSGRFFEPISAQKIPKDNLFVAGTHELSFDSRYAEFGLVNVSEVEGCYAALF